MGFRDKVKEWGGGDLTFLSEDGEVVKFVVAGDPELIKGKFKGSDTKRAAIPIFTPDGQSLMVIGMRVVRRLSKYEEKFQTTAFQLVRSGEKGDQNSTYDLTIIDDKTITAKLINMLKAGLDKDELAESYKAAIEAASA
ncbi:hypothetical protein LCGC14_0872410 [marine sediment metagenome]|uniref:Uncharacterized protein n=1 Tax=marine sediment metagenome TaxID=412755 RepID=A0A0F9P972_9ZZZZ